MNEPEYTQAEMDDRAKQIEELRNLAIDSWKADRRGNTSLVVLTYGNYLELKKDAENWRRMVSAEEAN